MGKDKKKDKKKEKKLKEEQKLLAAAEVETAAPSGNEASPEEAGPHKISKKEFEKEMEKLPSSKSSAGASRTLARLVQKEITARTRQTQGPVRDRGVKSALFYVLLGARMPAVLVETAFISNRAEEQRLASPAYQQLVADGVARAVVDFAGKSRVAAR